jgi:hypothetical protein
MRLGNFLEVGIKTTMTTMNFCVLTNLKMAWWRPRQSKQGKHLPIHLPINKKNCYPSWLWYLHTRNHGHGGKRVDLFERENRLWNTPFMFILNNLNRKIRFRKVGPLGVLIKVDEEQ